MKDKRYTAARIKTESQLYELARDVNGYYNACITYYTPGISMHILFAGYAGNAQRDCFIKDNLNGYTYAADRSQQELTVYLKGK